MQIMQCSLTNTLDEVQILGQQVFKVFLNQHLANVQPNAGLAVVVVVVQVVRLGRNIQDRFELNLSLHISNILGKYSELMNKGFVTSALKWIQVCASEGSLEMTLKNFWYSSSEMESLSLDQMATLPLRRCQSHLST